MSGKCYDTEQPMRAAILAVDSRGNAFVGDTGDRRVVEYNAPLTNGLDAHLVFGQKGVFTTSFCNGSSGNISADTLCNPNGVALDAAGDLYITDYGNDRMLDNDNPLAAGGEPRASPARREILPRIWYLGPLTSPPRETAVSFPTPTGSTSIPRATSILRPKALCCCFSIRWRPAAALPELPVPRATYTRTSIGMQRSDPACLSASRARQQSLRHWRCQCSEPQ